GVAALVVQVLEGLSEVLRAAEADGAARGVVGPVAGQSDRLAADAASRAGEEEEAGADGVLAVRLVTVQAVEGELGLRDEIRAEGARERHQSVLVEERRGRVETLVGAEARGAGEEVLTLQGVAAVELRLLAQVV